jgi:peroxiredoxin
VYEKERGTGVEFVGIGLLDNEAACREFVKRHHLTFPNGYDGDGRVARAYGFTYQPYWAVVSRSGQLIRTGYGPANEAELAAAVQSLAKR